MTETSIATAQQLAATAASRAGEEIFENIGCATCHVSAIVTAPPKIHQWRSLHSAGSTRQQRYSPLRRFLLQDIGTGDGIVQNSPEDTANKLSTVPLRVLLMHPRHMHDLKSLTLEDAIERHGGEADHERIASAN